MIPIKAASVRSDELFQVICMIIVWNAPRRLQSPSPPLKRCLQMRWIFPLSVTHLTAEYSGKAWRATLRSWVSDFEKASSEQMRYK